MTRPSHNTLLEHEATAAGRDAGWAHAAYVAAHSGDLHAAPDVPLFYRHVATFYAAGYAQGIRDFESERLEGLTDL